MQHRILLLVIFMGLVFFPKNTFPIDNALQFESYLVKLINTHQLNDPTGELTSIALLLLSDPGAPSNDLIQLQPSWYANFDWATEYTLTNVSRLLSNNILARIREYRCVPKCDPFPIICRQPKHTCMEKPHPYVPFRNIWVSFQGSHLEQDKIHQLEAFHSNDCGIIGGFDFVLSNWLSLGLAGGYTHTELEWDELRGKNFINNFYIGPYFVLSCNNWILEGSLVRAAQQYRSNRHIHFHFVNKNARSTHYGDSLLGHLGFSKNCYFGNFIFSPYVKADYVYIHANKIKEKKAFNLNLHIHRHYSQFFQGEAGAAFSYSYITDRCVVVPTLSGGYQNITPTVDTKLRSRLVAQPGSFRVKTTTEPINQGTMGFFLNIYVPCWPEIALSYNGSWGNKRREYMAAAELDWCF